MMEAVPNRHEFPPALDVETLLAHEPFVRALARSLVYDENEADDVVQQTMVAALEHPPRESGGGLRGWFAAVARNVVRQRRREEGRRTARQVATARLEGVPSTADLLARESARRTVVEAVLALDEPYRTAIVLRYFEGLPPREVAARLGVPVETVRTRLKRAVAMLRGRLDRRHRDRRAWIALLLPLAGAREARAAPWKPAAAAAAVVALGVGGYALWREPPAAAPDAGGTPVAWSASPPPTAPDTTPTLDGPPSVWRRLDAAPSGTAMLRGFVLESGRRPVANATVQAQRTFGTVPEGLGAAPRTGPAVAVTTDAQGRFEVRGLADGTYELRASARGDLAAETTVQAAEDPPSLVLWLRHREGVRSAESEPQARGSIEGTVTWDPHERAVEGTVLELQGPDLTPMRVAFDAEGRFRVEDVPPGDYWLRANSPHGLRIDARCKVFSDGPAPDRQSAHAHVRVEPGARSTVSLSLVQGATVRGLVVRAADDAPIGGARVELYEPEALSLRIEHGQALRLVRRAGPQHLTETDSSGRYEIRGILPNSSHEIRVVPGRDLAVDVRHGIPLPEGDSVVSLEHRLGPAGVLEAAVEPEAFFALRREDAPAHLVLRSEGRGPTAALHVPGLATGRWELCGYAEDSNFADPLVLARFDVRAGETTRVDTMNGDDVRMTGRVVRDGKPLAGAWVRGLGSAYRLTDANGEFEFKAPLAVRMLAVQEVRPPEPFGVGVTRMLGCMAHGSHIRTGDLSVPSTRVEVRVVDEAGRPVAEANVSPRLVDGRDERTIAGDESRVTDADGVARWVGLPAGGYEVVSGGTPLGTFSVADGEAKTVDVRLAPPK
jgi:RNA polymerase sigma-70 factor (ECF subfamily)